MGACLCPTTAFCRTKPSPSKMVRRPSLKPHSGLACLPLAAVGVGGHNCWVHLALQPPLVGSMLEFSLRVFPKTEVARKICLQCRGEDRSVQSWPAQACGACGSALSDRGLTSLCLFLVQSLPAFQLQHDPLGKLLLEDGKGRCPFDPEYRSTAIMVGKELWGSQRGHPGHLWVEVEGLLPARKDDLPWAQ